MPDHRDPHRHNEVLREIFKKYSKVSIRWKKDAARDYCGPAILGKHFEILAYEQNLTAKDIKNLVKAGILLRTNYRIAPRQPLTSVYVLTIVELPQTNPVKKLTAPVATSMEDALHLARTDWESAVQVALGWILALLMLVVGVYGVAKLTYFQYARIREQTLHPKTEAARALSAPLGR